MYGTCPDDTVDTGYVFKALRKGIDDSFKNELRTLNDFMLDNPVIPFPSFLFNFQKSLFPICTIATVILIFTLSFLFKSDAGYENPTGKGYASFGSQTTMANTKWPSSLNGASTFKAGFPGTSGFNRTVTRIDFPTPTNAAFTPDTATSNVLASQKMLVMSNLME